MGASKTFAIATRAQVVEASGLLCDRPASVDPDPGARQGVGKDWRATVLVGETDTPLAGGEVELLRVARNASAGKVRLTVEQLGARTRVRLAPP